MATKLACLRCLLFLIITAAAAAVITTAIEDQSLDVGTMTPKIYLGNMGAFVGGLSVGVVGNVPVLPVTSKTNNPPMFNFVLKRSEHQISLKIRSDNLRPIGYQMQTPSKWLEFAGTKSNLHMIPGSKFLGFGTSYQALENAAKTKITDVPCSKADFVNAINQLAVTSDMATRAKSLILILQIIVESARYRDVEYLFANNFDNPSCRIKPYMVDPLEKNWENLSTMVIKATNDKCYKYVPPLIQGNKPDTLEELSSRFGILYRDPSTLKPPCTSTAALHGVTRKNEPVTGT